MNIILCHLKFSMGPVPENMQKLCHAAELAGEYGADWMVTPEMALQGYYFSKNIFHEKNLFLEKTSYEKILDPLLSRIRKYRMALFLGAGEKDESGKLFNSLWIFNREGILCGRHRKAVIPRGGAEDWAQAGAAPVPVQLDGFVTAPLVCADAWKHEIGVSLAGQGAELAVDAAAWAFSSCCPDPVEVWKIFSRNSGLPLIIANQTGKTPWMDMNCAMSAIIDHGSLHSSYAGAEALLLTHCRRKDHMLQFSPFKIFPFIDQ